MYAESEMLKLSPVADTDAYALRVLAGGSYRRIEYHGKRTTVFSVGFETSFRKDRVYRTVQLYDP